MTREKTTPARDQSPELREFLVHQTKQLIKVLAPFERRIRELEHKKAEIDRELAELAEQRDRAVAGLGLEAAALPPEQEVPKLPRRSVQVAWKKPKARHHKAQERAEKEFEATREAAAVVRAVDRMVAPLARTLALMELPATPDTSGLLSPNASFRLVDALEHALADVRDYVAKRRREATEEHDRGGDDWLDTDRAERYAPVVDESFACDARRVIRAVADAIRTADTTTVGTLVIALGRRQKRAWYGACATFSKMSRGSGADDDAQKLERAAVAVLPKLLSEIDPRAANLTKAELKRAYVWLSRPDATVAAFAARLACDCGAFGYGQSRAERKKAKTAFKAYERATSAGG